MTATIEIPADTPEHPWIRTSERLTWTQCPQKWKWAYVDRIKPAVSKPALRFGSLIHEALEEYYLPGLKRGPHPAKTFRRLYQRDREENGEGIIWHDDGQWASMEELGVIMLQEYIKLYGKDRRWKVLQTEYPFHWPVYDKQGKCIFVYVGVVDGVWEDRETRQRWVVDHKTCGDDPTKKGEALVMDEQSGAYWSFGVDAMRRDGILRPDVKLDGMMYNFLRKSKPDDRPKNALGQSLNQPKKELLVAKAKNLKIEIPTKATVADLVELLGPERAAQCAEVSAQQPAPLFHREPMYRSEYSGAMVRERVAAQAAIMGWMRNGELPVTKTPGTLHSPHCKWCDFKDMCELHESGDDWEMFRDATMTKWEPYSQHAIEDGEKR